MNSRLLLNKVSSFVYSFPTIRLRSSYAGRASARSVLYRMKAIPSPSPGDVKLEWVNQKQRLCFAVAVLGLGDFIALYLSAALAFVLKTSFGPALDITEY